MATLLKNLNFAWNYFVLGERRGHHGGRWVEPPPLEGQLWFGDVLVADLHKIFPHQGTWFSDYDLRISKESGELEDQLLTYVEFCEEFNRRIADGYEHDFEEFDQFGTITNCDLWSVVLPHGQIVPMEGRLWFADGGVNWQHPETDPSTEAAANEFWAQNAKNSHDLPTQAEQAVRGNRR
jgi:hypothetical protein